jgi:hypothetical protein
MKINNDYPLSTWLVDLRDIISKRELKAKKDVLIEIVEDIEEILDMYEQGMMPQQVYEEMVE